MPKTVIWTSRVLVAFIGIFMLTSGINVALVRSPDLVEGFAKFGYPESAMVPIGVSAFLAALLYMIPRTSILGAILLTGYLGGAVATHLRISDPTLFAPLVLGILVWLSLYLRDGGLRTMIPLRFSEKS